MYMSARYVLLAADCLRRTTTSENKKRDHKKEKATIDGSRRFAVTFTCSLLPSLHLDPGRKPAANGDTAAPAPAHQDQHENQQNEQKAD